MKRISIINFHYVFPSCLPRGKRSKKKTTYKCRQRSSSTPLEFRNQVPHIPHGEGACKMNALIFLTHFIGNKTTKNVRFKCVLPICG